MSAFTPPRADFKGGKQSEDAPAISRSIFTPSTTLCLFAGELSTGWLHERRWINPHRLGLEFLPETAESVGRRFRNMAPFRGMFGSVVGEVESRRPHGSSALTGHMTVMWAARCAHNNITSRINPSTNQFIPVLCANTTLARPRTSLGRGARGEGNRCMELRVASYLLFFLYQTANCYG